MGCSTTTSEIQIAVDDLPLCNDVDIGWYILSGDERQGYAIYLTTEHPPFISHQMVDVFCRMPADAMLHMFKDGKVMKGRGYGEIPFNANHGRGKAIPVLSMQQTTRLAYSR